MAKSLSSGQEVRHLSGTSRVCSELMEQNGCRGFVDGHSAQMHPYIKELKKLRSIKARSEYDLLICEDGRRSNRLMLLIPRLEEWILKAAHKAGIRVYEQYRLSSDADKLHDDLFLGDVLIMNQFRKLVQRLYRCSDRVQALYDLLR